MDEKTEAYEAKLTLLENGGGAHELWSAGLHEHLPHLPANLRILLVGQRNTVDESGDCDCEFLEEARRKELQIISVEGLAL